MLILDKQRAVERIVALTSAAGLTSAAIEQPAHARTYQRIATFDRRASAVSARRGIERRRRRTRALAEPSPV